MVFDLQEIKRCAVCIQFMHRNKNRDDVKKKKDLVKNNLRLFFVLF